MQEIDLTGQVIGDIVVLGRDFSKAYSSSKSAWRCRCICGRLFTSCLAALGKGRVPTCGKCAQHLRDRKEITFARKAEESGEYDNMSDEAWVRLLKEESRR